MSLAASHEEIGAGESWRQLIPSEKRTLPEVAVPVPYLCLSFPGTGCVMSAIFPTKLRVLTSFHFNIHSVIRRSDCT